MARGYSLTLGCHPWSLSPHFLGLLLGLYHMSALRPHLYPQLGVLNMGRGLRWNN